MAQHRLTGRNLSRLPTGSHGDGNGLALLVQPTGSRSWIQRLKVKDGPFVTLGLGGYPLVSLREARQMAFENRRLSRQGINPKSPKMPTFKEVAAGMGARKDQIRLV